MGLFFALRTGSFQIQKNQVLFKSCNFHIFELDLYYCEAVRLIVLVTIQDMEILYYLDSDRA